MGEKIAYCRVSTIEQNEARQIEALEQKYDIDKWYIDKCSGKDTKRPQLQQMLDYMREGDTIYIHEFSRLARSTKDLLQLVEMFKSKGVTLVSNKESIDTSTPEGKLMLTMIGAINEFEREIMLQRQREGIDIAQKAGRYKGGQKKKIDEKLFNKLLEQYNKHEINKSTFAKELGVARPTLYRLFKERGFK